MASAMRKMAVYLGLVEDDHRYQDKYDSYGEYEDYDDQADRPEQIDEPEVRGVGRDGVGRDGEVGGGGYAGYQPADWRTEHVSQTTDLARITTLHPRTYNEARTIGEHFRRSEEHTSELQSQSNLVCRLLLEKNKRAHMLPIPLHNLTLTRV